MLNWLLQNWAVFFTNLVKYYRVRQSGASIITKVEQLYYISKWTRANTKWGRKFIIKWDDFVTKWDRYYKVGKAKSKIQSEYGKIWTRKTPNTDTFHAVWGRYYKLGQLLKGGTARSCETRANGFMITDRVNVVWEWGCII